jgi:hypothetical protein
MAAQELVPSHPRAARQTRRALGGVVRLLVIYFKVLTWTARGSPVLTGNGPNLSFLEKLRPVAPKQLDELVFRGRIQSRS